MNTTQSGTRHTWERERERERRNSNKQTLCRVLKPCNDGIASKEGMPSHYKCLEFNLAVSNKLQGFNKCQTCYNLKPNSLF